MNKIFKNFVRVTLLACVAISFMGCMPDALDGTNDDLPEGRKITVKSEVPGATFTVNEKSAGESFKATFGTTKLTFKVTGLNTENKYKIYITDKDGEEVNEIAVNSTERHSKIEEGVSFSETWISSSTDKTVNPFLGITCT